MMLNHGAGGKLMEFTGDFLRAGNYRSGVVIDYNKFDDLVTCPYIKR